MTEVPEEFSMTPCPADKTAVVEPTKVKRPRKFKKILKKMSYESGLSGNGTTLLDRRRFGRLTWRERRKYGWCLDALKDARRECFRQACINVLGEDPEADWE